MPYATVPAVLAHYPPIGSLSTISSAYIATQLSHTQAEIDARLAGRYVVPFSPIPPLIEAMALDMTVHAILTRRVFTGERTNTSQWPDAWRRSFDLLDRVATGDIPLVTSSGALITQASTGGGEVWSNTMANTPTMNEGPWVDMMNEEA